MSRTVNWRQSSIFPGVSLALVLFIQGVRAESPYPQLQERVRQELRVDAAMYSHLSAVEQDAIGLLQKIMPALLETRLDALNEELQQMRQLLSAQPSQMEAAELQAVINELMVEYVEAAEPVLSDETLQLLFEDPRFAPLRGHLQLRSASIGRALLASGPVAARQRLLELIDDARQDCQLPEEEQGQLCDWLHGRSDEPSLEFLNELLPAGNSHLIKVLQRSVETHHESLAFEDCAGQELTDPDLFDALPMNQPDRINLAVAQNDLDSAIALALHERVLLPTGWIDPRLPDLLNARYGEQRVQQELAHAVERIEERQVRDGRAVVTTVFGNELQLPARCLSPWAQAIKAGRAQQVTEFTTPVQHLENLRRSALFQSLQGASQSDRCSDRSGANWHCRRSTRRS